MRRRQFVGALAAFPAAPALIAQQAVPPSPPPAARPPVETKLEVASPEAAAEPIVRFFSTDQFAALRKVSGMLMPKMDKAAGRSMRARRSSSIFY